LPVTVDIVDKWAEISVPDRLPVVDGLLAATAIVHGHTLVTRNTRDVARSGVSLLNPFE
jgi:predicted nucleic acid-binding protein